MGGVLAASDAFLKHGDSKGSDDDFFSKKKLGTIHAIMDSGRRNDDLAKRVIIAILDSGVDMTHKAIKKLRQGSEARLTFCDINGVQPDCTQKEPESGCAQIQIEDSTSKSIDLHGHGTHITATVLQIANWSQIFVARVVDDKGVVQSRNVSKALDRALDVWHADIIIMSFGFDRPTRDCADALNRVLNKGLLVFAAASNRGASTPHASQTWPANDARVFGVYSADFMGNSSSFNPPETQDDGFSHFKFLGEDVESAWPSTVVTPRSTSSAREGFCKMSGTSVAAPIAAGTAALFLELLRQNSKEGDVDPAELAELAKSPQGMREIFTAVGKPMQALSIMKFVLPWHLIKTEKYPMHTTEQAIIKKAIKDILTRAISMVEDALEMRICIKDTEEHTTLGKLQQRLHAVEDDEARRKQAFEEEQSTLREEARIWSWLSKAKALLSGTLTASVTVLRLKFWHTLGLYLIMSDGLAFQRQKTVVMLERAIAEQERIRDEFKVIKSAFDQHEPTSFLTGEEVLVAIKKSEAAQKTRLRMIDFRREVPETYPNPEIGRSSQEADFFNLPDNRISPTAHSSKIRGDNALDALKDSLELVGQIQKNWKNNVEFLANCSKSFEAVIGDGSVSSHTAKTIKATKRPILPGGSGKFPTRAREIISEKYWYQKWDKTDDTFLRSGCKELCTNLDAVKLEFNKDLVGLQDLKHGIQQSIRYLKGQKSLQEKILKFEQKQEREVKYLKALEEEYPVASIAGEMFWLTLFLTWLGII